MKIHKYKSNQIMGYKKLRELTIRVGQWDLVFQVWRTPSNLPSHKAKIWLNNWDTNNHHFIEIGVE
jgi:hypothetical protein